MPFARTISGLALATAICLAQSPRPPVQRHPHPRPDPVVLTADDVSAVVQATAAAVNSDAMVIAVTDRQGDILAIYSKPSAPATSPAAAGPGATAAPPIAGPVTLAAAAVTAPPVATPGACTPATWTLEPPRFPHVCTV